MGRYVAFKDVQRYSVAPSGIRVGPAVTRVTTQDFGVATRVDSGSTYSYFPPRVDDALVEAISLACESSGVCGESVDGRCWRLPPEIDPLDQKAVDAWLTGFPKVQLLFRGGVSLPWSPRGYLSPQKNDVVFCYAWRPFADKSFLGASFLKHAVSIFDRRKARFGYASANCPEFTVKDRPKGRDGVCPCNDGTVTAQCCTAPDRNGAAEEESLARAPLPLLLLLLLSLSAGL